MRRPRYSSRRIIGALGLVLALAAIAPTPTPARGPLYGSTYASKITNKLWRGAGNTLFCWLEVPIEINREIQNTDPFTGFFVGTGKGLWYTVRRLGLCVTDFATFPVDVFNNNYQSIQRTEFPFIDEVE